MGAILIAFGLGILLINQSRVAQEMDRELFERVSRGRGPGGGGRGIGGGPGGPGGPGGMGRREPGAGVGGQGPIGEAPQIPRGLDEEGFRIANLRRPRVFDGEMNPVSLVQDLPFDDRAARQALATDRPIYSYGSFEGERIRIVSLRLRGPGPAAVIQAARETRELDRLRSAQLITLALLLPVALIAAGAGGLFLTNRALKPIGDMQSAASRITESSLGERLQVQGDDELAQLGRTFNQMLERLDISFAELKEAYEQQRRFTADASHELRTPLTKLKLSTSSALEPGATDEDRVKALTAADRAAESMARLVNQLLLLAKADAGQLGFRKEPVDLRVAVSEAIEQVVKPEKVELVTEFPDRAVVEEADADAVRRVVVNLLENAYRYALEGRVAVQIKQNPVSIVVADDGLGVPQEHLSRLGERFYRVDESRATNGGGSGLGLAICRAIMEAHGGRLEISSQEGRGTQVAAIF